MYRITITDEADGAEVYRIDQIPRERMEQIAALLTTYREPLGNAARLADALLTAAATARKLSGVVPRVKGRRR